VVLDSLVDHDRLALICTDFDCRKEQFFQTAHLRQGCYRTVDRQGQCQDIPLVTISLAVITQENFDGCPNPAQFGEVAAGLKKKVKASNALSRRSGFLLNRRLNLLLITGADTPSGITRWDFSRGAIKFSFPR